MWSPAAPASTLLEPLGYLEFLDLERHASAVVTDSGGIQEETTFFGVPCFTLRDNTERPVTVDEGTNTLLGLRPEQAGRDPLAAGRVAAERPQRTPRVGRQGRRARRRGDHGVARREAAGG